MRPSHFVRPAAVVGVLALALGLAFTSSAPALRAAPDQAPRSLVVELDVGRVSGVTAPAAAVGVRVLDAMGAVLHEWSATAGSDGRYALDLVLSGGPYDPDGRVHLALTPGTVLAIDEGGGDDPLRVEMPVLVPDVDVAADRILGRSALDGTVRAEVFGGREVVARSEDVAVDVDGRFAIELGGRHDLAPGSFGRLTLVRPNGDVFTTTWVAFRATLELDTGQVWLEVPSGQHAAVRLVSPDGRARASATWRSRIETDPFARRVYSGDPLRDPFGARAVPLPGERLEGEVAGVPFAFDVPRVAAAADLDADRVAGHAGIPAGTAVRADVVHRAPFGSGGRAGTVGADGSFALDFAAGTPDDPPYDLVHGARVTLRLEHGALRFRTVVPVSWLVLSLDGARLEGRMAPGAEGVATWRRAGQARAELRVATGLDGAFAVDLRQDGERLPIAPGDEMVVSGAGMAEPAVLVVPALELALDPAANALVGRMAAPPGTAMRLDSDRRQGHLPGAADFGRWDDRLTWDADDRFRLDFDEHPVEVPFEDDVYEVYTLVAGARVTVELALPTGHLVVLRRQLPLVVAQVGGVEACGYADPDAAVALEVAGAAGQAPIRLAATTGPDGQFYVAAPGDEPALTAGARLSGQVGEHDVGFVLPELALDVDWLGQRIVVRGQPERAHRVKYPATILDCWGATMPEATAGWDSLVSVGTEVTTNADGLGALDLARWFERGARADYGLRVDTFVPELHGAYAVAYGLQAEVLLGTGVVAGRTSPGAAVDGRLSPRDGAPAADARAVARADGRFELRFDGGRAIEGGDALDLAVPGDRAELAVPPLDFDVSARDGVLGLATPGAHVQLTFGLSDGHRPSTTVVAGDDGRFAFRPADVPTGAGWGLDQATSVRAEHLFQRHHRVVRETGTFERPSAPPRVYLPLGFARAR